MRLYIFLLLILMILFSYPVFAGEYDTVHSEWAYKNQPKTLNDAVNEIKLMFIDGKSRLAIAKRVTQIADIQINNVNDLERMNLAASWNPFGDHKKQDDFELWRNNGGAEEQTDVVADWIWDSRFGQCAENSALVYQILKEAGAENVRLVNQPGHRFVIWFEDAEAAHDNESSYTDGTIIPDSWQRKILTGKDAYSNKYCGAKNLKLTDVTHIYDQSAEEKCGYSGAPCCKATAECRHNPGLVCKSYGKCGPCGKENQDCCKNDRCDSGLLCNNGKCDRKEKDETSSSLETCAKKEGTDSGDFCYYQYVMATCETQYCAKITKGSVWRNSCDIHSRMCG